jgi:transposase
MGKFIQKSKGYKGSIRVRIITKERGIAQKVEHIGVAHNEDELKMYMELARERLRDKKQQEFKFDGIEEQKARGIIHKRSYSKFLYNTLENIYNKIGIEELKDEVFKQITIGRIIRPASKLETVEILDRLGLKYPLENAIYRCLKRAIKKDYRWKISEGFIKFAKIKRASILLYDVTTLYFEIDKEDEYRKGGYSKERRLEPQIVIGLLVDEKGFPLAISSFEGNKTETKTILPVLKEFRQRCKVKEMTVVADAGMLSGENLELLEGEGFKFIVGSRVGKTPYEIEEYRKEEKEQLIDGQIFEAQKKFKSKQRQKEIQRRVVYQYRQKRAELDLRNIEKQIRKAQWQIENKVFRNKPKFLRLTQMSAMLDEDLINEARNKAGIKGYVTNLDCDAKTIINGYHNLFQVEKSFRMTKSDLQARPIFHQTRDSIEAHLTVCFAALGICRYIQDRTKLSIKRFVKNLEILRTAIIEIAGQEHIAEPEIDIETKNIVKALGT